MTKSTSNFLLYLAETILEHLQADETADDQEEVKILSKQVESLGRYLQSRESGPGYMKMTRSEFLNLYANDAYLDMYVAKADLIESEGGFLPE